MAEDELSRELEACRHRIADLERQLADRQSDLLDQGKDLQQFAHVAAHDFREPLRAIVNYTQLIELRYGARLDEKAHEFMEQVVNSAHRMGDLVDGLVSYSRVTAAEAVIRERVNLNGVLAGVMLKLDKNIRETGASIKSSDLPEVSGEEQSLDRLFQELITNALVYRSEKPPNVRIGAVEKDDCWEFEVTDDGIGIDPRYHERIFGLFKRLHGPNIPGVGLGLAICRKIVERHGGKLWVESQAGQGSTFRFTLPE